MALLLAAEPAGSSYDNDSAGNCSQTPGARHAHPAEAELKSRTDQKTAPIASETKLSIIVEMTALELTMPP